jgi:hypothetical protein
MKTAFSSLGPETPKKMLAEELMLEIWHDWILKNRINTPTWNTHSRAFHIYIGQLQQQILLSTFPVNER